MRTINPLLAANNILYLSSNENIPITPMKLQKLLYFLYKDYLIKTNNSLFSDRFEAWKYGPALSIIHDTFGHYKDYNITQYYKSNDRKFYRINEKTNSIFSQILYFVWNTYKFHSGIELAKLTQKPGTAWYKAWINYKIFLEDDDIRKEGYYENLSNKTWSSRP